MSKCTCDDCKKDTIRNRQREVVIALQRRLLASTSHRSGDIKDLSTALGVAIDKLNLLTPHAPYRQFNQVGGLTNVASHVNKLKVQ